MRLLAEHSPRFDPSRAWEGEAAILRGETRLFRQLGVVRRSPHTGRSHDFTRLECPAWVNVIAFTPREDGLELLVVEQFRHGIDASTLESIGGVCEPGEDPALTARRELLEETGYQSEEWVSLGWCTPNPAVQDNRCHFFLALNCRAVAELDLDPSEELRVWAVSWREWQAKLRSGEIHHALVLTAFFRLGLWEGWGPLQEQLESQP